MIGTLTSGAGSKFEGGKSGPAKSGATNTVGGNSAVIQTGGGGKNGGAGLDIPVWGWVAAAVVAGTLLVVALKR